MYAIFKALGKQFKAEEGDVLRLPRMQAEPGSKVTFDEVLLTADGDAVNAGTPLIKGAKVECEVIDEVKDKKIYVFRYKRRSGHRKKTGHRQKYTDVRVTGVKAG